MIRLCIRQLQNLEPGSGKAETHWFTVDQKRIDGDISGAFIAFPGGTGTLEKIAEVMSKVSLKQLDSPCILYNLNGYYDHLKALLAHMIDMGLSTPERQEGIYFADNLDEIRTILKI